MASQKHFLQDRTALLLVSVSSFLTVAAVLLVLLRLGSVPGTTNYIVSYRSSLGIDRYTTGTVRDVYSFIVAAVLIFVVSLVIAYRSYAVRRELSLVILALGIPLLVFLLIVSNSLLVLR